MPQVSRTVKITASVVTPLPAGITVGEWKLEVRTAADNAHFATRQGPTLAHLAIVGYEIGSSYIEKLSRLDSNGNVLVSMEKTVLVEQLPEDPLYDVPTDFDLVVPT